MFLSQFKPYLEDHLHLVLVPLTLLVTNKPTTTVERSGRVPWLTLRSLGVYVRRSS